MKKSIFAKIGAVGLVLGLSSTAFGTDNGLHGALCNPQNSTAAANIGYGLFGVQNNSTTSAIAVQCGGAPVRSTNINLLTATVYDRHASQDVCCFMDVQNADGSILASSNPCSSGFGSGSQLISFTPPANSGQTAELECSIPPQTANGLSHVTSYRIRS
jgi:hypothetical protein